MIAVVRANNQRPLFNYWWGPGVRAGTFPLSNSALFGKIICRQASAICTLPRGFLHLAPPGITLSNITRHTFTYYKNRRAVGTAFTFLEAIVVFSSPQICGQQLAVTFTVVAGIEHPDSEAEPEPATRPSREVVNEAL